MSDNKEAQIAGPSPVRITQDLVYEQTLPYSAAAVALQALEADRLSRVQSVTEDQGKAIYINPDRE